MDHHHPPRKLRPSSSPVPPPPSATSSSSSSSSSRTSTTLTPSNSKSPNPSSPQSFTPPPIIPLSSSPAYHHHHSSSLNPTRSNLSSIRSRPSSLSSFNNQLPPSPKPSQASFTTPPSLSSNPQHDPSSFQTTQLIKQLVLRARLHDPLSHPIPSPTPTIEPKPPSQGFQVIFSIQLAIPSSILPSPGSPDLILPLMSDHRLRLNHHHIFPLTRRSPNSKPSIKASNHHHQASLAASILKLSKSFRVVPNSSTPAQAPSVSITIRNFAISLVISPVHSPLPQHNLGPDDRPAVFEYAILLDCLSLWATTGPDWPLSVILPTPRCLKNSFRLLLPTKPTIVQAGSSLQTLPPSSLDTLNTFPPLRRERLRFSTPSRSFPALTKSARLSDDDLRPLSDESEPEGIGLSCEDDERNFDPRMHWAQDELHPRIEGVFQSSQDLCILLGSSSSQISSLSTSSSLSARNAQSQLSLSLPCAPSHAIARSDIVSMDLRFTVDLHGVNMRSINSRVPLVLAIPQPVAASMVSARWSPLNGEGVIETAFPEIPSEQDTHLAGSTPTTRRISISSISSNDPSPPISRNSSKLSSELDLLNTPAPFLSSKLELRDETIQDDSDPDLSLHQPLSFSPAPADQLNPTHPEVKTLSRNLRHELVAWIDTEWLIRRAATSPGPVNSRLVFNLHAKLELAVRIVPASNGASQQVFSIPFLMLPSIDAHDCACHISGAPSDSPPRKGLDLATLPPWATVLDKSPVDQSFHIKLSLNGLHPESADVMTATFDDTFPSKSPDSPIAHEGITVKSPSTYKFPHTEPNLSIQTLIINPTRRAKHLSRKSTITPITIDRRRSRLSDSFKSRLIKRSPTSDKELLTRPTEVRSRIQPRIQSVQIESVVNRSSDSQSQISQYVEMSISFFLPSKNGKPYLNLNFPVLPGGSFEVLGAWIGDRELTQDHDFEISQTCKKHEDLERPFHSIALELTSSGPEILGRGDSNSTLPDLRMIVKSEIMVQPQLPVTSSILKVLEISPLDSFLCTMPSFDIPVAIYRVSLQSCAGFQIELKEANMLVLESSMHKVKLVQYSLPVGSTPHTSASIKPTNSSPPYQLDPSLSPIVSDSKQLEPPFSSELPRETSGSHVEHNTCTLSLYEKYAIKWAMNWKALLLCWLIYLVSSMGIQLDQISSRLGRMEVLRYSPDERLVKVHPSGEIHSSIESTGELNGHEVQSGKTLAQTDRGSSLLPDLQEWKRLMLRRTLLDSYGQEGSSVADRVREVFVREKIQRLERPSGRTDHRTSSQKILRRGDDHHPLIHDDSDRRSKEEPRQAIVKDFLGLFDRYLLYLYRPYMKFLKRINLWMGQDDREHDQTPREPSPHTDHADRKSDFSSRQSDDHHRVEL